MTHRDGFPQFLWAGAFGKERVAWRCGPREPRSPYTSIGRPESPGPQDLGKPPFRSRGRTGSGRMEVRREALTMPRIACDPPPARPLARRIARAISMGHYQGSLV